MPLRNAFEGLGLDSTLQAILAELGQALTVLQPQAIDAGNTKTVTAADASPGVPWVGAWTPTRTVGVVRELVVLAATASSGLGGTFTFEYSENGTTATISEARAIGDFETVRDFDLINAGAFFRVKFEPSRALAGDSVFITTTLRTQDDGSFVRLANQQIEEANAAMGHEFAFIKAFDPITGKSRNIRPTPLGALRVADDKQTVSQSGSLFVEGIRDDIDLSFSRNNGSASIARLINNASVNGTVTHDVTQGQAVFAVPATAGSRCYFESDKTSTYEPGHMIRGGMTIELSALPTGTGKVEWGFGEDNGAGDILNGIGWGVDSTGLYAFRKKAGAYAAKTYRTSFNRDRLDGSAGSRYRSNNIPVIHNPLMNGIYEQQFEWYGVAPPTYLVTAPAGVPIEAHCEETTGQQTGTTVPEPALPLFIRIQNGGTQALQVRTGSWRGGVLTNKVSLLGRQPDLDYVASKADGTAFVTTTPLGAAATYTSQWFDSDGWSTIELVIATDQVSAATGIQLQYTDDVRIGSPIVRATEFFTFGANEVARGFTTLRRAVTADGFRIVYQNGGVPQGSFFLEAGLRVHSTGPPLARLESSIDGGSSTAMGRNALFASDGSGYGLIGRGTSGGLDVGIVQYEAEAPLKSLSGFVVTRVSVNTVAAAILTPTANRRAVSLKAITSAGKIIYVAENAAKATPGSGFPLNNQESLDLELDATATIYASSDSGTQALAIVEGIL